MLIGNMTLITSSYFVLCLWVEEHYLVMWVCIIVLGIALATSLASALAWTSSEVTVTGHTASIFLVPFALAMLTGPTAVGYFFDEYGPMWYLYVLTFYSVIIDVLIVIIIYVLKRFQISVTTTEDINENKDKMNPLL